MDLTLLATKLQIPPLPPSIVPRPRLVEALEQAAGRHRLTLVAAPAGYGKTTLLAQWARATRLPVVWLTLGPEDADADRVLRYLLRGWAGLRPGVEQTALGILLEGMNPDRQAVLTAFVNAAVAAGNPLVFVLDDYHLLANEDPTIHEALAFLIDHLPPHVHFVLAGRTDPPLPLARYRARGEMLELRAEALGFSPAEMAAFLHERLGADPPAEAVARLHAQLEGWAAGLQLVTLRQARAPDPGGALRAGGQRFVADYLREDVLADLPGDLQRFLLETGILDQLCGPLCDAVTGRGDSQARLEELEHRSLFLVPLDDRRAWFRYHRLFADFLREELHRQDPLAEAALHARAARWYLAQGLPDPALQHAVAGDDPGIAERVLDDYATVKLQTGELRDVARWLHALPPAWHTAYPSVGLARAGLFVFTGDMAACLRCIEGLEQRLSAETGDQARADWGKVSAVRCAIACIHDDLGQAETYADRALHDLPGEEQPYRHLVHGALGDSYRRRGRWADARQAYLAVLALPEGPGYQWHAVHVRGALADLALSQGRLREAAGYWRQALAAIEEPAAWGRFPLPLIGWVYIRLGEILYEWNDPAQAAAYLAQGLERAELGGDVRGRLAAHLLAARLQLTAGDYAAADSALAQARALLEPAPLPDWTGRFARLQVESWLAQDRLRAAVDWAGAMQDGADAAGDSAERDLAVVRVRAAAGDRASLEQAAMILARLRRDGEAAGRTGVVIEALALQALAHARHGDLVAALTALERALRLAEPEGYVRLFADLGLPLARLLQEARARDVLPDYVDRLLAACGDLPALPSLGAVALPEPLSAREQDVLRLLAAGLTNREIAATLVVSPETVKKHTGSIYGKLGVRGRVAAVARARTLALLD